EYRAGQFVSLFREDGLARSYSLASLPGEGALELHVRKIPGGAMSGWLYSQALHSQALHSQSLDRAQPGAQSGVPVWIQGPSGNCFYVPGKADEPLLLAGAGTGLAPLYGIARDALQQGHSGPIW